MFVSIRLLTSFGEQLKNLQQHGPAWSWSNNGSVHGSCSGGDYSEDPEAVETHLPLISLEALDQLDKELKGNQTKMKKLVCSHQ